MQSADISRCGDEIATVWRDYEYALSKMSERDPEAKGLALSLAQLAQEERHAPRRTPFWKRIF